MKSIQRSGKNNPCNGNLNNDNKTYLPAKTTTLRFRKDGIMYMREVKTEKYLVFSNLPNEHEGY